MEKIDYVRQALEDASCHVEAAYKTSITRQTFANILAGDRKPHANTINTLYAYFKKKEKAKP